MSTTQLIRTLFALCIATSVFASSHLCAADTAAEYNARGVEYYNAREWDQSIRAFRRAYDIDSENETLRANLSNAYRAYANQLVEQRDIPAAIEQLQLAVRFDPQSALPLVQLGSYYLQEGLVTEAIYRLEEAIELEPRNVNAHFLLGEAYHRDNDVTSALDQWEWVTQVDPDRPGLADRYEASLREERVEYNFSGDSSRHFNITFDPNTDIRDVRDVLHLLELAFLEIGRQLGHTYPPTPIQVTLYSAEGFAETTQMGEHVGALYDGSKIRVPIIDSSGELLGRDELKRRLFHEYVHVVVRHIAKDNVPWWFNEGLAEVFSHSIVEQDFRVLQSASRQALLFQLQELSGSQLERLNVDELKLAYRQSHATVTFLKNRGVRAIILMLHQLGGGEPHEAALRRSFHFTYKTLELAVAGFINSG